RPGSRRADHAERMAIELNHTIVHARDPHASATFLSEMLGRPAPARFGPFWDVELDNRVTLAFTQADDTLTIEHYAFRRSGG
ncbi:MAG: hypothetical protein ABI641_07100, partial [Caldimonas sp.]